MLICLFALEVLAIVLLLKHPSIRNIPNSTTIEERYSRGKRFWSSNGFFFRNKNSKSGTRVFGRQSEQYIHSAVVANVLLF